MSTPTPTESGSVENLAGIAPGSPDSDGPLPLPLLEFAGSMLKSFGEAHITWLVGLPGSGKSTILQACRAVDDRTRTFELSQELAALGRSEGPPRPGGLQALGDAADRVRARWAESPARTIVATTGVPVESVPRVEGEQLLILAINPARADLQLRSRPQRAARTAAAGEIVMHRQNVERLARLAHAKLIEVPFIPALVGRAVP